MSSFMRRQDYPIDAIILERITNIGPTVTDGEGLMDRIRMLSSVCQCMGEVIVAARSRIQPLKDVFVADFEAIHFRSADAKWINPWAEVPAHHIYLVTRGVVGQLL